MTDLEHLLAIYANPDDHALRAVYADWLLDRPGERDAMRGELITIQLAHAAGRITAATLAREDQLLNAHGRRWTGELADDVHDRVFEAGFLAGGRVSTRALAHPAAALFTTLHDPRDLALVDARPWRVVHAFDDLVVQLASGPPRGVREVGIRFRARVDPQHPIATCAGLPALTSLALDRTDRHTAALFLDAPVIERITRLRCDGVTLERWRNDGGVVTLLEGLVHRAGALRTIELGLLAGNTAYTGWRVWLERDRAPGPFSTVIARCATQHRAPKDLAKDLLALLELLPPGMSRFEVDVGRPARMPPTEVSRLITKVEALRLEHCIVPWKMTAAVPGRRYRGALLGADLREQLPALWERFAVDLAQPFDAYSVNDRGTPALGRQPLATLAKRMTPDLVTLAIRVSGRADHVTLGYRGASFAVTSDRSHEELVAWFARLLEVGVVEHAHLRDPAGEGDSPFWLGYLDASGGWLVGLRRPFTEAITDEAIASLTPRFPGLRRIATRDHVVLVTAATPEEATPDYLGELVAALRPVLDAYAATIAPHDLGAIATPVLAPVAAELRMPAEPVHRSRVRVEWQRADGIALRVRYAGGFTRPWWIVVGFGYKAIEIHSGDVSTAEKLAQFLDKLDVIVLREAKRRDPR